MKQFTQAPLPFQGQKRFWNNDFEPAIKKFDHCDIFVDLFGGSGLLSRMAKDVRPDATVIYNDFDGYCKRVGHIGYTNELLAGIREILAGYPRGKLIAEPYRTAVLACVKEAEERVGYVDYITLSASILFSMKYTTCYDELVKESLYNNVKRNDCDAAGYLDGLEVVECDYRELFAKWRNMPNVCFLTDPPYLSTDTSTYTCYWRLKDYLDVLYTLKDTNYIYFTSNKSSIVELCDWLDANYAAKNPFHGATRVERVSHMNYESSYVDIMMYKKKK